MKNFDPKVGLECDEFECQSCTFWDFCDRTYGSCNKYLGWQSAMMIWNNPDDVEIDVSESGC